MFSLECTFFYSVMLMLYVEEVSEHYSSEDIYEIRESANSNSNL